MPKTAGSYHFPFRRRSRTNSILEEKNLILLIYIGGTKLRAKIEIFWGFWLENLRYRWKMGRKVRISIWKEISSGFQKWHQIFDTLIRSLNIPWNVTYGDFLKKARIQLNFQSFWDFWDFELQLLGWKHV